MSDNDVQQHALIDAVRMQVSEESQGRAFPHERVLLRDSRVRYWYDENASSHYKDVYVVIEGSATVRGLEHKFTTKTENAGSLKDIHYLHHVASAISDYQFF